MRIPFKTNQKVAVMSALASITALSAQTKPNVVFVFADQLRSCAMSFNGDKNVIMPNFEKLATEAVNVRNTVSVCPVSTPFRASLITGLYPEKVGMYMNDLPLNPNVNSIGKIYKAAGYKTAYIGKWHLNGGDRLGFIPSDRRQGFEYWNVMNCTHKYMDSQYWGNDDKLATWKGYDAYAQTNDAINYIKERKQNHEPFFLVLSWGPPHDPFPQCPETMKAKYKGKKIDFRPNVPADIYQRTTNDMVGYYGQITALDSCIGALQKTIKDAGLDDNTIFVFTSDHGEMLSSQGLHRKQVPYDESAVVPMLIKYPALLGKKGKITDMLLNTPDIMPTLLGMCNLAIPTNLQGKDKTPILTGKANDTTEGVLFVSDSPFGSWSREKGGKEYRGVRTKRYTYVKDLNGPWLFFDNLNDPYQLKNLANDVHFENEKAQLEKILGKLLNEADDDFLPGIEYQKKWNTIQKMYKPADSNSKKSANE